MKEKTIRQYRLDGTSVRVPNGDGIFSGRMGRERMVPIPLNLEDDKWLKRYSQWLDAFDLTGEQKQSIVEVVTDYLNKIRE